MKTSVLLLLIPYLCLADGKYVERDWWRQIPLADLPVVSAQPFTSYTRSPHKEGFPGREVQSPHSVTIGLRNTGTNVIEKVEFFMLCSHGIMTLQPPDGTNLMRRVPTAWRGIGGPGDWTAIGPDEACNYVTFPLWQVFPITSNLADGTYTFWWQLGSNDSNRVTWQKTEREVGMP